MLQTLIRNEPNMALDEVSFAAGLKTLYPGEAIKDMVYKKNPFFALVPKDETFFGDSSKEPIIFGNPQNRSASFAQANVINSTTLIKAFLLTRVQNYSMAAIANETMLASESDKGAFLKAAKVEIDGALHALSRAIASQLYRSGTGSLSQLSASAVVNSASTEVLLAVQDDITYFEDNMPVAFSATDGGTIRTGTAFLVSIDRQTGAFLASATPNGAPAALSSLVSGVSPGDFMYSAAGDLNAVVSGLRAWLPGSAVTNTPFFGVDRSRDKSRLAGMNFDGSAESIEEALIDGAAFLAREGATPDHCFVSYKDFRNLEKALGSKLQVIQYTNVKVDEPKVTVGFTGMQIMGPSGPIKVVPDQNCPAGSAFMLQMDTWKLKSLGECVRLFDGDGLTMIRDPNGDNLLVRCFSYAQLSCRAPGWNGVITLPS